MPMEGTWPYVNSTGYSSDKFNHLPHTTDAGLDVAGGALYLFRSAITLSRYMLVDTWNMAAGTMFFALRTM